MKYYKWRAFQHNPMYMNPGYKIPHPVDKYMVSLEMINIDYGYLYDAHVNLNHHILKENEIGLVKFIVNETVGTTDKIGNIHRRITKILNRLSRI